MPSVLKSFEEHVRRDSLRINGGTNRCRLKVDQKFWQALFFIVSFSTLQLGCMLSGQLRATFPSGRRWEFRVCTCVNKLIIWDGLGRLKLTREGGIILAHFPTRFQLLNIPQWLKRRV